MKHQINLARFVGTSARTVALVSASLVLGASLFATPEAFSAEETVKQVTLSCTGAETKDVKLRVNESAAIIGITGCICALDAAALKSRVMSFDEIAVQDIEFRIDVEPGKTKDQTIYCYSIEQLRDFTGK